VPGYSSYFEEMNSLYLRICIQVFLDDSLSLLFNESIKLLNFANPSPGLLKATDGALSISISSLPARLGEICCMLLNLQQYTVIALLSNCCVSALTFPN
jgi:hypothetical protein